MKNEDVEHLKLQRIELCPLCGSSQCKAFEYNPSPSDPWHAVRCCACELIYMNGGVSPDDLERLFDDYARTDDAALAAKRQRMYALDYEFSARFLKSSDMQVLDVGCGAGDFLQYFSAFQRHGVEIDPTALARARRKQPLASFYRSWSEIGGNALFDLIIFRGTLQYMPDLSDVRNFCTQHLASGGRVLVLATPNADSLLAQVQREHWVLFDRIEHRYCFGINQIRRLFGPAFALLHYDLPYLGTPYENYLEDYRSVLALVYDPSCRQKRFPFFGSMMNITLEKL